MALKTPHLEELYGLLLKIKNRDEAARILGDLLTPAERKAIAERWQIVKLLRKGVPHREISKKLRVSISLVTRGSKALQKNKGGFSLLLSRF